MDRPFNFWDLLIGVGYGILRIDAGLIDSWAGFPSAPCIVCTIIWLATICLQIARSLKQRQTPEASRE